jgi:hypothetical protein
MARRGERRRSRPGSGRRRSDRRRLEDRRAYFILGLAAVAIALVGSLLWASRSPALDPETGCGRGSLVPEQHTVVLIDQTDPLTIRQIDYVKTLILLEYQRLRPQGKLTIRNIFEDPDSNVREFTRCRVRRGSEVSAITNNPDKIEADFRRIAGDPLNNYLDALARAQTADASPILETVDSVLDGADFGRNVDARRLVIVSDLAQHSELVSHYEEPGVFPVSARARQVLSREMDDVEVRAHYVRRPQLARVQTSGHRRFWTDWFRQAGADVELGWGLQMAEAEGGSELSGR